MSKELTPLQKLNNLYFILCHYANKCGVGGAHTKKECGFNAFELKKDIEKELKALEIIRKNQDIIYICKEYDEDDYTEKEIEEMGGQKYYLCDGSDQYKKHEITKEEYDLLKEVLKK